MTMQPPYRSRLFQFVRQSSRRWVNHWQRQTRQVRVQALWGIQVALFPAYRFLRRQPLMASKHWLTRGWQQLQSWAGSEAFSQLTPPADRPIQQLLSVIQINSQPIETPDTREISRLEISSNLDTSNSATSNLDTLAAFPGHPELSPLPPELSTWQVEIQPLPVRRSWKFWPQTIQVLWQQTITEVTAKLTAQMAQFLEPLTQPMLKLLPTQQQQRLAAYLPSALPRRSLPTGAGSGLMLQGVAMQLTSQEFVLVGSENQILPPLAPTQQRQLQQRLVWELADYYRRVRQVTRIFGQPIPALPVPTQSINSLTAGDTQIDTQLTDAPPLSTRLSDAIPSTRLLGKEAQAWMQRCQQWLQQLTQHELAPRYSHPQPFSHQHLPEPRSNAEATSLPSQPEATTHREGMPGLHRQDPHPTILLKMFRHERLVLWRQLLQRWQTSALVLLNASPLSQRQALSLEQPQQPFPKKPTLSCLTTELSQHGSHRLKQQATFLGKHHLTSVLNGQPTLVAPQTAVLQTSPATPTLTTLSITATQIPADNIPVTVETVVVGYEKHWLEHILIVLDHVMVWLETLSLKLYQWSLQGLFRGWLKPLLQQLWRRWQTWFRS